MKRNSFLFASVVCFIVIGISGCNGTTQSAHDSSTTEKDSDSNTVAPEPDKRVNDSVKSADTVTQKAVLSNVVEQSTDCANGAKLENGKCVCADGSVWLGESWYCILNGQRCFAKECLINGDAYPQGTDFIYGSIVTERDSVRKYVCKNNVWSSRKLSDYDYHDYKSVPVGAYSFLYESNFYCGGIPVYSLGKDGEFTTCEMHDPECKSNAYRCSYHHWLCADEKGCQCFDGYETKNIKHDEVCENLICKNSMSESMVSDLYTSETQWMDIFNSRLRDFEHDERPGYCLDEQCPCGDGYCMRYGTCTDGICSCYNIQTNMHGEFYCNHYG